jgi:hypothetical protein
VQNQRLHPDTLLCSSTLIFQHKASKTDIVNAMDMVIPVRAADTPLKGHAVPVVVSRTNTSPLSYAAFRDHDLMNDLGRFAALHNLRLDLTYLTSFLLGGVLSRAFSPTGLPLPFRFQIFHLIYPTQQDLYLEVMHFSSSRSKSLLSMAWAFCMYSSRVFGRSYMQIISLTLSLRPW